MREFTLPLSLQKAASGNSKRMKVGGVASAFHRDLDGEAIDPKAVEDAIPGFMAGRGPDGKKGGPICLNHNFYQQFLKQAIRTLQIPQEQQYELVSAMSLPLGRVDKMWVDKQGKTHWEGELSGSNPISRIIYDQLNEGTISLGVSLGGKIYATEAGRDRLGKPCTLITSIRIDELSITQNPALRLVGGEDESNGAYIQALAKSAARSLRKTPRKPKQKSKMSKRATQRFLQKALDSCDSFYPSHKGSKTKDKKLKPKPKGNKQIANNDTNTKTGLGGEPNKVNKPKGKGKGFKIGDHAKNPTVKELTRELGKCAQLPPEQMGSDEVINQLSNGAQGLAGMPEESPELINFAKLLQYLSQYAGELQKMADNGEKTRMKGTAKAMQDELTKALSSFSERVPDDIKAKPLRPPQGPGVNSQDIQFPSQYFPID